MTRDELLQQAYMLVALDTNGKLIGVIEGNKSLQEENLNAKGANGKPGIELTNKYTQLLGKETYTLLVFERTDSSLHRCVHQQSTCTYYW